MKKAAEIILKNNGSFEANKLFMPIEEILNLIPAQNDRHIKFYNSIKIAVLIFTGYRFIIKEFCFCVSENTNNKYHVINSNEVKQLV